MELLVSLIRYVLERVLWEMAKKRKISVSCMKTLSCERVMIWSLWKTVHDVHCT